MQAEASKGPRRDGVYLEMAALQKSRPAGVATQEKEGQAIRPGAPLSWNTSSVQHNCPLLKRQPQYLACSGMLTPKIFPSGFEMHLENAGAAIFRDERQALNFDDQKYQGVFENTVLHFGKTLVLSVMERKQKF